MENLEVMVVLFIIVVLGYVACKLGYMGDKFDKKLSSNVGFKGIFKKLPAAGALVCDGR